MNPFIQMILQALQGQHSGQRLQPGTYRVPSSMAGQLYGMMGGPGQQQFRAPNGMSGQVRMEAPRAQVQSTNLGPANYGMVTNSPMQQGLQNPQMMQVMQQQRSFAPQQQVNQQGMTYQPQQIGMMGLNTKGSHY